MAFFVWGILPGVIALVLGIVALAKTGQGRPSSSKGMAVTAVVLGSLSIVVGLVALLFFSALGDLLGDSEAGGAEKVGLATCQDDHLQATIAAVRQGRDSLNDDPYVMIDVEVKSRDSYGYIDLALFETLTIISESGRFVAEAGFFEGETGAGDTERYSLRTESVASLNDTWESFTLRYTVRDGHDRGESEGSFSLRCSLGGDNMPHARMS